jgi:hypothetical protein
MSNLRRTPIRPSGADLVRRIAPEVEELPPAKRDPKAVMPTMTVTATEQINFRGSPDLARLLARLAAEQGSIRLVVAKLLQDAGHDVSDVDLLPPPGRRRL